MSNQKISERKVILYTAGLLLFAGIIRYLSYPVGSVIFYMAFLPFMIYRIVTVSKKWHSKTESVDSYRILVLIIMVITLIMNVAGWQEADFFLLFLLMIDYLLVINRKF